MNHDDRDKVAREEEWPDELDAMVAAPEHHEVLFENDRVVVLNSRIKPGGVTEIRVISIELKD